RRSRSRRDKGFRISAESKRCSGEADSAERAALRKGNLRMAHPLMKVWGSEISLENKNQQPLVAGKHVALRGGLI
ncbi:hypothetical protein L0N00_14465, partial [Eggerthella lenta]|nr:hypothetical protein [Eggerthella lenta]